jgi:hypothetical protein
MQQQHEEQQLSPLRRAFVAQQELASMQQQQSLASMQQQYEQELASMQPRVQQLTEGLDRAIAAQQELASLQQQHEQKQQQPTLCISVKDGAAEGGNDTRMIIKVKRTTRLYKVVDMIEKVHGRISTLSCKSDNGIARPIIIHSMRADVRVGDLIEDCVDDEPSITYTLAPR